jgi:eukaryotic-like serine/threonine-protein kinase
METEKTSEPLVDARSIRRARAQAVAMTASVRGVVDAAVVDEHLKRYLAGGAHKDFLCELIEGKVIGAHAVREILSGGALPEAAATGADPRSTLVVPIAGVDENAPPAELAGSVFAASIFAPIGMMSTQTQSGTAPPARSAPNAPEGYELVRPLGRGGMGEVLEVRDQKLLRHSALKRIRADKRDALAERLFLQEAQITAQLEHPNIPPIHVYGRLPTGEPYFTMKRVQGTTLRALLKKRLRGDPAAAVLEDPHRLGLLFLQVLQALSYAHARGVVHCDLKPDNILLGAHGEVLVMDWGLASLVTDAGADRLQLSSEVVTRGSGTPPYMAPEQLVGDVVDARSDVYGLGVILFELLTNELPYGDADPRAELLVSMFTKGPPSARTTAPDRDIDEELDAICLKALSARADERYENAEALRMAIEQWLTGSQRRRAAQEKLADGEAAQRALEALAAERAAVEERTRSLRARTQSWAPPKEKQPLWDAEDRLAAIDLEIAEAHANALDAYSRALGLDPSFTPASDKLADLHLRLFLAAELAGDRSAMLLHRRAVERHHRGRHANVLSGMGALTLAPQADDTTIEGVRLVERGRTLSAGDALVLPARIEALPLSIGSYLFTLRAPGMRELRVHVAIERGVHVVLRPTLHPDSAIGADFVPVPAGPFIYGGDPHALNAGPREVRETDAFAIARTAVTCAQYLAFLNDLSRSQPDQAALHVPRTRPDGGFLWQADESDHYTIPAVDADGNPAVPEAPVMGVSFDDALAYAAWRSTRDGVRYRLPTEVEWEKAARGADGRVFPWGNGFDATFCKMALSRPGRPQPEPVGTFRVDTSVYGMQDAAGGIREWCDSFYDDARQTRVLRGGAWYFNAAYCRVAFRHGYLPHIVFTNFGIRLCRSLP